MTVRKENCGTCKFYTPKKTPEGRELKIGYCDAIPLSVRKITQNYRPKCLKYEQREEQENGK